MTINNTKSYKHDTTKKWSIKISGFVYITVHGYIFDTERLKIVDFNKDYKTLEEAQKWARYYVNKIEEMYDTINLRTVTITGPRTNLCW